MKTKCKNGRIVDHWYDRKTRQSVTQVTDKDGNQIDDAEYSGNRTSAKLARAYAIKSNGGKS